MYLSFAAITELLDNAGHDEVTVSHELLVSIVSMMLKDDTNRLGGY